MVDSILPKPGELRALFDEKRLEITGETLEWIRHNYYIAASMSGDDSLSIGGLQINPSGRMDDPSTAKKKKDKARTDLMMMAILERQLQEIEMAMIRKYGEDFAEQFAAELLDQETFEELMRIQDPEERRKAIALSIHDGVKNGSIDAAKAHQNPDFKEWLDKHTEAREFRQKLENGSPSVSDALKVERSNEFSQGISEEETFDALFGKNGFLT